METVLQGLLHISEGYRIENTAVVGMIVRVFDQNITRDEVEKT